MEESTRVQYELFLKKQRAKKLGKRAFSRKDLPTLPLKRPISSPKTIVNHSRRLVVEKAGNSKSYRIASKSSVESKNSSTALKDDGIKPSRQKSEHKKALDRKRKVMKAPMVADDDDKKHPSSSAPPPMKQKNVENSNNGSNESLADRVTDLITEIYTAASKAALTPEQHQLWVALRLKMDTVFKNQGYSVSSQANGESNININTTSTNSINQDNTMSPEEKKKLELWALPVPNEEPQDEYLSPFWDPKVLYRQHLKWPEAGSYLRHSISSKVLEARHHTQIDYIEDSNHPCYKQNGLFAKEEEIRPDEHIGFYGGEVRICDVNSMDEEVQGNVFVMGLYDDDARYVYIDASRCGNELRYVNDYRGVPNNSGPNCEFVPQFCPFTGDLHVEVRTTRMIEPFEELLIDYGADYWEPEDNAATNGSQQRVKKKRRGRIITPKSEASRN